jgi:hypothetical protein
MRAEDILDDLKRQVEIVRQAIDQKQYIWAESELRYTLTLLRKFNEQRKAET